MKNKQIVIQLHEGCLDPKSPILQIPTDLSSELTHDAVKLYIKERLINDPYCLIIDKVEVVDCDCDVTCGEKTDPFNDLNVIAQHLN